MYDFILFTDVTNTLVAYKPIGAYKCAYQLRQAGYSCLVVDHIHTFTMDEFNEILDLSMDESTVGVGFSSTFFNTVKPKDETGATIYDPMMDVDDHFFPQGHDFEQQAISYIKQKNNNCKIILGGVRAHANLKNKLVDYCVVGYAETSMLNLANHLVVKEELRNSFKNIWGRTIISNKLAPDFDFKNSTFSWDDTDVINAQVLPLEISRGCIFKCKFCSYPLTGKKDLEYVRQIEILRNEMKENYDRYGVTQYYILDDTFNDNELKLDALLEAIEQLPFQPIFWAYTRLDLLTTRKNVDKLYKIGLRGMYFGIESMNPKTARLIGKGYDRPKQIEMIRYIRERYGDSVMMHGSFIIGLPHESLEMVADTHKRLMSQEIPLHTYRFAGLWLDRDTKVNWLSEFSKNYQDYGYVVEGPEHDDALGMKWTNEYMERSTAVKLAEEFNEKSFSTDTYRIPGQLAWALLNYGHSFDHLSKLKYKDIDWYEIESKLKPDYMTEYKHKLKGMLVEK